MLNQDIKREIILDHYQYPRNHGLIDDPRYLKLRKNSDTCIDDITVQILIEDHIIKDIKFDGEACTISTSSTSIIAELVMNKNVEDAKKIINEYYAMLNNEPFDDELLQQANAFNELYKQANRIKCGLIGVEIVAELLNKEGNKNGK